MQKQFLLSIIIGFSLILACGSTTKKEVKLTKLTLLNQYTVIAPMDFTVREDPELGEIEINNKEIFINCDLGICLQNPVAGQIPYSRKISKDSLYIWHIDTFFMDGSHKAILAFYKTSSKCKVINQDSTRMFGAYLSANFHNQDELETLAGIYNSMEHIKK